jgi:hypothetical protein
MITQAGRFASADGRAWTRLADVSPRYAQLPYPTFLRRCKIDVTRVRRIPFGVTSRAVARGLAGAVGVRPDCTNLLGLSDDGGRTWRVQKLPRRACSVSVARDDVWLGCGHLLLVSGDRGHTWARLDGPPRRFDAGRIAAAGDGRAWAAFASHDAERLWRTADGGRTWVEQWPRLPTP